jgi:hypothetical protein
VASRPDRGVTRPRRVRRRPPPRRPASLPPSPRRRPDPRVRACSAAASCWWGLPEPLACRLQIRQRLAQQRPRLRVGETRQVRVVQLSEVVIAEVPIARYAVPRPPPFVSCGLSSHINRALSHNRLIAVPPQTWGWG